MRRNVLHALLVVLALAACAPNAPAPPATAPAAPSPSAVAAGPTAPPPATPTAAQPTALPPTPLPTAVSGLPLPTATAGLPTERITDSMLAALVPLRSVGLGRARGLAITPDNSLLVVATTAGVALFDLPSLNLLRFDPSEGDPYQLAISGDSKLLALVLDKGAGSGVITELRAVATGQVVTTIEGTAPLWSPDGALLALEQFSENRTRTRLFRSDGTSVGELLEGTGAIFSPDGSLLATTTTQQPEPPETLLYRTSDGSSVGQVAGAAGVFSPDGQTLATAVEPGVRLWRVPSGDALGALEAPVVRDYYLQPTLAFSADGRQLHEISQFDLRIWDLASGTLAQSFPDALRPAGGVDFGGPAVWSPDGGTLAVFSPPIEGIYYGVRLIRAADTSLIYVDDASGAIAYSRDSSLAALVSEDGQVQVVSLSDGTARPLAVRGYSGLAFSPDGGTLAAVGSDVTLWDVAAGAQERTLALEGQFAGPYGTSRVQFSPDGTRLGVESSAGGEGVLFSSTYLWDLTGGDLGKTVWERSEGAVAPIISAYSPASDNIASSFDSPEVMLLAGGSVTTTFTLPVTVTALAFNPIGTQLAAGDAGGNVALRDGSGTGETTLLESGTTGQVTALAYSSDGTLLAAHAAINQSEGRLLLWRVGETKPFVNVAADAAVARLALSADGQTLAAAGPSGVAFYRVGDGRELHRLPTPATDIALDPARRLVAVLSGERILLFGVR